MIEVKNLYKSFEDKDVLKDICTVFEDGKTNLIIGQSGSGDCADEESGGSAGANQWSDTV